MAGKKFAYLQKLPWLIARIFDPVVKKKRVSPSDMDDHGDNMTRSCRHLSQCGVSHIMKHVRCAREKVTCEVHLSTLPVGYSRLLSAVNETYCNKQTNELKLSS